MPPRSRSSLARTSLIAPAGGTVRLARDGELQVRVHGRCHGLVWCAGQLHWSWGAFAHAFALPARSGSVAVVALGLLGVRRARVQLDPRVELHEPRMALTAGSAPRTARASLRPRAGTVPSPPACARALPVPTGLVSRAPSPVLRELGLALRLPRPGESR